MHKSSRLHRSALMLALAAAYPALGHSAAGTAQFTSGEVMVRRGAAAPSPLTKGATLESGDAITTGARGIAQVKFTDGGYVSVQPNSQFDITRYADTGNAQNDSFLVNLARGGMRAITGLIGKRNTANYKVTTSTATVGIRGSSFNLAYNPDGTLSVATEQDAIEICTAAGCVGLTAGESAVVRNPNDLPSRTNVRTSMPTDTFTQEPQIAGNQVGDDGRSSIVTTQVAPPEPPAPPAPPPPPVPRLVTGLSFYGIGLQGNTLPSDYNTNDSANLTTLSDRPTALSYTDGSYRYDYAGEPGNVYYTSGSAGSADYIFLGGWDTVTRTDGYSGTSTVYAPFDFVAGRLTPEATLSSLGDMAGTYSLLGASPVRGSDGTVGTLLDTSKMVVRFDGYSSAAALNLDISLPYVGASRFYYFTGTVNGYGSTFSGTIDANGNACAECGYGEGYVDGFFSGSNAQHAALMYRGYGDGRNLGGTAVFGQGSLSAPVGQSFLGAHSSTINQWSSVYLDPANSARIVGATNGAGSDAIMLSQTGTLTTHGRVDVGGGDYLTLGTWSLSHEFQGEGSVYFNEYSNFAFVSGQATQDMSIANLGGTTATYTLQSASPVYISNQPNGTLDAATLGVNFDGTSATGTLTLAMTGNLGSGGVFESKTASGSVTGYGSSFSGTVHGDNLSLNTQGNFYGAHAEWAGIVYEGLNYSDSVHGAAILSSGGAYSAPQTGTYNYLTSFVDYTGNSFPAALSGTHSFADSGGQYLAAATGGMYSVSAASNGGFDYNGSSTNGDFIGWGKWATATLTYNGSSQSVNDVYYLVGMPTPAAYLSDSANGTATYALDRGTTPIGTDGTLGILDAASLSVTFGASPLASAVVSTKFGPDSGPYNYYTTTVNNMAISTATATFGQSNPSGRISGLLAGSAAQRAALTYAIPGTPYGVVSGALGMNRSN